VTRSHVWGNGASNSQGPVSESSPVPKYMRSAEWLMLQETRVHQLAPA
jgi:hypothetical protein